MTGPDPADAALGFLRRRGCAADQEVDGLHSLTDVLIMLSGPLWRTAPALLAEALTDWPRRRAALRHDDPIAPWPVDTDRAIRWVLLRRMLVRVLVLLVTATAAHLLGDGVPAVAAVCAAAFALSSGRFVRGALLGTVAILADLEHWYAPLVVIPCAVQVDLTVKLLQQLGSEPWWMRGPVLGFLPRGTVVRLAFRGRLTAFRTAVDLAANGADDTAEAFLATLERLPPGCRPVVEAARGGVALARGDLAQAQSRGSTSLALAASGAPSVLAWCQAMYAVQLAASGREEEAHRLRQEALTRLRQEALTRLRQESLTRLGGRRTRGLRRRLLVENARYVVRFGSPETALQVLRDLRQVALRRRDFELLTFTELQLVHLMTQAGNTEGAMWTLEKVVSGDDARVNFYSGAERTARELLLRAALRVEDPAKRGAGRQDALAALAMLGQRRPVSAAAARLVLARAEELDDESDLALASALTALRTIHDARYDLVSERGRRRWEHTYLTGYDLALRLAGARGDAALVAQLVELARGEVLPADPGPDRLAVLASLEALEASWDDEVDGDDGDARPVGEGNVPLRHISVVERPPRIVVGHHPPLFPAKDGDAEPLLLDREICATAGLCWYWSGCVVAGVYHWAARSPAGRWHAGHRSLAAGSDARQALDDLAEALPLPLRDESPDDVQARAQQGALARRASPSDTRERDLLTRLTRAFLPPPLAEALAAGPGPQARLLVSLAGSLALLPVAALVADEATDRRLVEVLPVTHVPAWSVVARARATVRSVPSTGRFPVRISVTGPDGDDEVPRWMPPPPSAVHRLCGAMSLESFLLMLEAMSDDPAWTLFVCGHVDDGRHGGLRGLVFRDTATEPAAEEWLTTDQLARITERAPFPARVAVVGCGSLGLALDDLAPDDASAAAGRPMTEWLGLGTTLVLGGAQDVVSALYPVNMGGQTHRISLALAEGLARDTPVWRTLQSIQVAELRRWRGSGSGSGSGWPYLWQAFVHVGVGGGR